MDSLYNGITLRGNERIYSKRISTKQIAEIAFNDMRKENIKFDSRLLKRSPNKKLFPKEQIFELNSIKENPIYEKGFYNTYFNKYDLQNLSIINIIK